MKMLQEKHNKVPNMQQSMHNQNDSPPSESSNPMQCELEGAEIINAKSKDPHFSFRTQKRIFDPKIKETIESSKNPDFEILQNINYASNKIPLLQSSLEFIPRCNKRRLNSFSGDTKIMKNLQGHINKHKETGHSVNQNLNNLRTKENHSVEKIADSLANLHKKSENQIRTETKTRNKPDSCKFNKNINQEPKVIIHKTNCPEILSNIFEISKYKNCESSEKIQIQLNDHEKIKKQNLSTKNDNQEKHKIRKIETLKIIDNLNTFDKNLFTKSKYLQNKENKIEKEKIIATDMHISKKGNLTASIIDKEKILKEKKINENDIRIKKKSPLISKTKHKDIKNYDLKCCQSSSANFTTKDLNEQLVSLLETTVCDEIHLEKSNQKKNYDLNQNSHLEISHTADEYNSSAFEKSNNINKIDLHGILYEKASNSLQHDNDCDKYNNLNEQRIAEKITEDVKNAMNNAIIDHEGCVIKQEFPFSEMKKDYQEIDCINFNLAQNKQDHTKNYKTKKQPIIMDDEKGVEVEQKKKNSSEFYRNGDIVDQYTLKQDDLYLNSKKNNLETYLTDENKDKFCNTTINDEHVNLEIKDKKKINKFGKPEIKRSQQELNVALLSVNESICEDFTKSFFTSNFCAKNPNSSFKDIHKSLLNLGGYVNKNILNSTNRLGRFEILDSLGSGSSANVRQGVCVKTGEKVAIKIVDRAALTADKTEEGREKREQRIYREVIISSLLCHPHIVRLKNFYHNEQFFYLVFEYVRGIQLLDIVVNNGPLSEQNSRRYFRQILSAMSYIHENNIVHRDLKIENILLDDQDNIKILDFGLSNFYDNKRFMSTFCGSLYFAAPELLQGNQYLGPEVDIWSLGVILYVLLIGNVPFDDKELNNLHDKIKSGKIDLPNTLSKEAKNLLRGMICSNPYRRLSLKKVINSSWINKNYTTAVDNFLNERQPLKTLHPGLIVMLDAVLSYQFDKIDKELTDFIRKKSSSRQKLNHYSPIISLYYLLLENFASVYLDEFPIKENTIEFNKKIKMADQAESCHYFVDFLFSKEKENIFSTYFFGAVFKSASNNSNECLHFNNKNSNTLLNHSNLSSFIGKNPSVKKGIFKGIFKGIEIYKAVCCESLKLIIEQICIKNSIFYDANPTHYICTYDNDNRTALFKISLFVNTLFNKYYITISKLSGNKAVYDKIKKIFRRHAKIENPIFN